MRKARAFFYVCAGVFLLALSYHLGARNATAQAPGNPVVSTLPACGTSAYGVVTANGDVYVEGGSCGTSWTHVGNVFGGGPVPVTRETFGALKSRYRGAPV